jgi:hypothetical protein
MAFPRHELARWRVFTLKRYIDLALRLYTYVFSFGSSLGLLGLGAFAKITGDTLVLKNMPWKGEELTTWLLGLGSFGLASSVAGVVGKGPVKFLTPLWNTIFAVLMIKGNFMSPEKTYENLAEFQQTVAATVAQAGSVITGLLIARGSKKA